MQCAWRCMHATHQSSTLHHTMLQVTPWTSAAAPDCCQTQALSTPPPTNRGTSLKHPHSHTSVDSATLLPLPQSALCLNNTAIGSQPNHSQSYCPEATTTRHVQHMHTQIALTAALLLPSLDCCCCCPQAPLAVVPALAACTAVTAAASGVLLAPAAPPCAPPTFEPQPR